VSRFQGLALPNNLAFPFPPWTAPGGEREGQAPQSTVILDWGAVVTPRLAGKKEDWGKGKGVTPAAPDHHDDAGQSRHRSQALCPQFSAKQKLDATKPDKPSLRPSHPTR
jgi:hypothetical protein